MIVNERVQLIGDTVLEMFIPPTGLQTISVNGVEVIRRGGASDSVEPVFHELCDALEREDSVVEWIKDRERVDDYPEGDESKDRYVLMREYPEGGIDMLETSDDYENLKDLMTKGL